jgi:hypothetical protein
VWWRANSEGGRQRLTTTAKDLTLGCGYSLRHGRWRGRPDPAAAPPPTHTGRFGAGGAVADQAPAMASAREGVGGSGRLGLGFFFENFFRDFLYFTCGPRKHPRAKIQFLHPIFACGCIAPYGKIAIFTYHLVQSTGSITWKN